jgi:hypothetical protein
MPYEAETAQSDPDMNMMQTESATSYCRAWRMEANPSIPGLVAKMLVVK